MPLIDLSAAHLPVYGEPGDPVALAITVPAGYEAGTWVAHVWRDTRKGTALQTATVGVAGQVVTPTWSGTQTGELVSTGTSRFAGYYEVDVTLSGTTRTILKGPFILDPAHRHAESGGQAVTVTINSGAVTVDAGEMTPAVVSALIAGTDLADLADVAATTPSDGQALVWDAGLSTWKPDDVEGGGGGGDVELEGPGVAGLVGDPLRTFRAAWAGRYSKPVCVISMGDSNEQGYTADSRAHRRVHITRQTMEVAAGGRPTPGYLTLSTNTDYLSNWSGTATLTNRDTSGLGYGATDMSAPGGTREITEVCDGFYVRYTTGSLIGGAQVHIDGVLSGTLAAVSGAQVGGVTWYSGPLTRGSHTIRITATDGFGFPFRLEGIDVFDGNGPDVSVPAGAISAANARTGTGLRWYGTGRFGSTAATFASSSLSSVWWSAGWDRLGDISLITFEWITNEVAAGTNPQTMRTNMVAVAARADVEADAAGIPRPSKVVKIAHGTGANAGVYDPYTTAARQAASDMNAAVYDFYEVSGFVGTPAADTVGITSSLDGATRKHLSTLGHREAGEAFAAWLLDAVGHRPAVLGQDALLPHQQLPTATTSVQGAMSATDKTKLDGIEASATADQTAAELLTAIKTVDGTGSGLDADTVDGVEAAALALDAAVVKLTGDQTIAGTKTFSTTPTVPNDSWTLAKIANIATASILGRTTASSGDIEELTAAQVKTLLAIASGDVSGLGALATLSAVGSAEITDGAIVNGDINNSAAIALSKLATIATARILGNVSGSTAVPAALTAAEVKTLLALAIADVTGLQAALDAKAVDADVVHDTGNETIAGTKTFSSAPAVPDNSWSIADTSGLQTALDGKQPIDTDLTTIAGLTATTDNVVQSVGSAWASRTPAQLKTTLALAKGDVGLGNVDNTSDANKPVSTAGQTALDLKANLSVTANNQTGTTYTLVLGDAAKVIECNNASAVTLTVPTNATVAFPTGTVIEVWQQGAGQVTIAGAGVTFRAPGGLKTRVQYSTVSLRKQATDTWVVSGDSAT